MWAPDSRHVAVLREKPAQGHKVHMVESAPKGRVQPKLITHDYLKPGDRIRRQRPHVFAVESGERIAFDESLFANPWAVNRFSWSPDGRAFRFLYNQRGHQVLRVVAVDRSGAARAVVDERSATFIDYAHKRFARHLDADTPEYLGIVIERFPSLDEFVVDETYFGDHAVVEEMIEHLPTFYDFGTAIGGEFEGLNRAPAQFEAASCPWDSLTKSARRVWSEAAAFGECKACCCCCFHCPWRMFS